MERPANESPWVRKQGHDDYLSYKLFHVFASLDCILIKVHLNGRKVNEPIDYRHPRLVGLVSETSAESFPR